MVAADLFTRWMEAFSIPNQEASTVANVLVDDVFMRYAIPKQLHSDQGPQFESQLMSEVCKLLGIQKSRTTLYVTGFAKRYLFHTFDIPTNKMM